MSSGDFLNLAYQARKTKLQECDLNHIIKPKTWFLSCPKSINEYIVGTRVDTLNLDKMLNNKFI
jgi:hypothetical protein